MFELDTYDDHELKRREHIRLQLEKQEAEQRARLEHQAEEFTLTGSDRIADVAGQGHLF